MDSKLIHSNPEVYLVKNSPSRKSQFSVNCFLLRNDDEWLIIDTGPPSKWSEGILRKALREHKINARNAKVFLTHFHADHAGLAKKIASTGMKVYAGQAEYDRTNRKTATKHGRSLYSKLLEVGVPRIEALVTSVVAIYGGKQPKTSEEITLMQENDQISVGSLKLQVVDTSGHTQGHLSLYEPQSKILFGGDHILYGIAPSIEYFFGEGNGIVTYLDHLDKIGTLPIAHYYHSHGVIRADHHERITELKAHHCARLKDAESIINDNPGIRGFDLICRLRWSAPGSTWTSRPYVKRAFILMQGLSVLELLVKQGRVQRILDDQKKYRYRISK